ncbi:MAG TPA: hypothetical protein VF269_02825 [Rhodanobacteraceae bacterium]
MKKLLITLILSTLVLSGCGLFRSGHAWKVAKQENPLQIPPGLDQPSTTAALTIPPPGNTQVAAKPAPVLRANATSMHLPGDVATAYKRVGLALQSGDLGTVAAQDAAHHSYRLSISASPKLTASPSFLQKHFSNINHQSTDASQDASGAGQHAVTVILTVTPAQGGGSTVSAAGDPQQAVHVISVLSSRLGG